MRSIDLLGWSGSVLVVLSLTQSNLRRLRLINLAASLLHLAFNILLGLIPMIALNAVLTGVNCFYLAQGKPRTKSDERSSDSQPLRHWTAIPGDWRVRSQLIPL